MVQGKKYIYILRDNGRWVKKPPLTKANLTTAYKETFICLLIGLILLFPLGVIIVKKNNFTQQIDLSKLGQMLLSLSLL